VVSTSYHCADVFDPSAAVLGACRKPWEHVAMGFAGAYAANWLIEMEDKMVKQIEDAYEKYSAPQSQ
jgi:hypothetical protein